MTRELEAPLRRRTGALERADEREGTKGAPTPRKMPEGEREADERVLLATTKLPYMC